MCLWEKVKGEITFLLFAPLQQLALAADGHARLSYTEVHVFWYSTLQLAGRVFCYTVGVILNQGRRGVLSFLQNLQMLSGRLFQFNL